MAEEGLDLFDKAFDALGVDDAGARECLEHGSAVWLRAYMSPADLTAVAHVKDQILVDAAHKFFTHFGGEQYFLGSAQGRYRWDRVEDRDQIRAGVVVLMDCHRVACTNWIHHLLAPGQVCPGCETHPRPLGIVEGALYITNKTLEGAQGETAALAVIPTSADQDAQLHSRWMLSRF